MQVQSKSLYGLRGSNFDIRVEYNSDHVIVHLPYVDKMTRNVFLELSEMLEEWWEFLKTVGYKGIHAVVEPNSKIEKLARMLKFELLGEYENFHIMIYKD